MHIKVAKNIGFCSGVRRAIDIVEGLLSRHKGNIYCLGPIIHNPQVLARLEARNLKLVYSLDKVKPHSYIILPSHGTSQDILNTAKRKHLKIIDVTCPYVSSVQKVCQRLYKEGYQVIIVGDREHPEVKALLSLAPGARLVNQEAEVEKLKTDSKIGIISQTTQRKEEFLKIVSAFFKHKFLAKELRVFDTICLDTAKRQEEIKRLAKRVGVLLVIGSKTSANTKRLYNSGRKINPRTFLIETTKDLNGKIIDNRKKIGIISGASTPDWLVKEVIKTIKRGSKKWQKKRHLKRYL